MCEYVCGGGCILCFTKKAMSANVLGGGGTAVKTPPNSVG